MTKKPVLYGPDNRPLKPYGGFFRRDAAKRTGSLSNWNPRETFGAYTESREREDIIARSINLINDDPNAAGIIDSFATTIIGPGLRPVPAIDALDLGISKERAREIEYQQKKVYKRWAPHADTGERLTDGEIQHLKCRSLFGMGDSFEIVHMTKTGPGRYSQTGQVINPMRVKTPSDKMSDKSIVSGIRIGKNGEAVSYFIKKGGDVSMSDSSDNFDEIPAKKAHRWRVLHDYIMKDPEQVRGYPLLSPAIRFFRNFADLLSAELVSNVTTAAMGFFVETEGDGYALGQSMTDDDNTKDERWQSMNPGEIWYGSKGEKPHMLAADRPGTTFDPFTKIIKKAISQSTGIPFNVVFKDMDGISFAGFRASMLEAWRVFDYHRKRASGRDHQKKYTMLMEEAYLRGDLDLPGSFYDDPQAYSAAEWYGPPKGDIEPFKAIQADLLKNKNGIKTKERIIIEDGGAGHGEITDQIAEERAEEIKKLPVIQEEDPSV